MALRPGFRSGSRGVSRPLAVIVASVGLFAALLAFATNAHLLAPSGPAGTPSPTTGGTVLVPGGKHFSSAYCEAAESSATLDQEVANMYVGNGNASGPGSGLIDQGPPGPSAYPSEAQAETNVVAGWQSVCESPTYYAVVQEWGAPSYPINALAQNQTGIYEEVVAVTWQAPSASCSADGSANGTCLGTAEWLINVASGSVAGPTTSYSILSPPGQ